jgi:hypothetical protein
VHRGAIPHAIQTSRKTQRDWTFSQRFAKKRVATDPEKGSVRLSRLLMIHDGRSILSLAVQEGEK